MTLESPAGSKQFFKFCCTIKFSKMLRQLKTGLSSVEEIHSIYSNRIKSIQHLNAYINVTSELSEMQATKSSQRISEGV